MPEKSLLEKAAKLLERRYGLTTSIHAADKSMIGMISRCGNVSCRLEGDCFEMGFSQSYGHFNYTKMHISHIGKASDIAFERCLRLSLASKASDYNHNDVFTLDGHEPLPVDTIPDVIHFYDELGKSIKKLNEKIKGGGINSNEAALSFIRTIPKFNVEKYPIPQGHKQYIPAMHYKWQRVALDDLHEELAFGLTLEEALKPLAKMTEAIEYGEKLRVRKLFDGVNFPDINKQDAEIEPEHEHEHELKVL